MKIFFHAPIAQKQIDDFTPYWDYIKELGHTHLTDFALRYSSDDLDKPEVREQAKKMHRKRVDNFKKADVVILGADKQSVGIGYYYGLATKLSKPVIVLCSDRKKIPFAFDAIDYNKLIVAECTNDNYKVPIQKALAKAQKLVDKRFTLLLPPDVVEMLDGHYHKTGETRSEYIRDLIRDDQQV